MITLHDNGYTMHTYNYRCGPMTRYWCMRYEGKHIYFKDLAHRIKQFKNIAMSLSLPATGMLPTKQI